MASKRSLILCLADSGLSHCSIARTEDAKPSLPLLALEMVVCFDSMPDHACKDYCVLVSRAVVSRPLLQKTRD